MSSAARDYAEFTLSETPPRVAVLLGAGASADAGIPPTIEMTDAVINQLNDREHHRILEFIRYTIAADLAQRLPSGDWGPRPSFAIGVDVERLFAAVELLIDRYDQPWSPFVGTWRSGLESFAPAPSVREFDLGLALHGVDSALRAALSDAARGRSNATGRILERPLLELIQRVIQSVRPSDVSALLADVRARMLRSLFAVSKIDDPRSVSYLMPLIELVKQQGSLMIASLNYDRAVENLADLAGMECATGIETWSAQGQVEWPENVPLRLLKLHGSIDWIVEPIVYAEGQLPRRQIRKVDSEDEKTWATAPAVVFGEAGKLRSEGPYLELLLEWSTALRGTDNLLVVGYSFRDEHVNEIIGRWFNAEQTRRIILVDTAEPGSGPVDSFRWYLEQVDARFDRSNTPAVRRFEHVRGRTCDVLAQAVEAVSISIATDAI